MKLSIDIASYGDSHYSEEAYGDWYSNLTNELVSVTISETSSGEPVDFNVEDGDEVFVVWAEYSSGDSFGNSSGNYDVIIVYSSEEKANIAARILTGKPRSDGSWDDNYGSWTVNLETEGGSILAYHRPWLGR